MHFILISSSLSSTNLAMVTRCLSRNKSRMCSKTTSSAFSDQIENTSCSRVLIRGTVAELCVLRFHDSERRSQLYEVSMFNLRFAYGGPTEIESTGGARSLRPRASDATTEASSDHNRDLVICSYVYANRFRCCMHFNKAPSF